MKKINYILLASLVAGCSSPTTADTPTPTVSTPSVVTAAITTTVINPPDIVNPPPFQLCQEGLDLITDSEVSADSTEGHGYYDRNYQHLTYPGVGSGPTAGVGVDVGVATSQYTQTCWSPYLASNFVNELMDCSGHTGNDAQAYCNKYQDVIVPWNMALNEFQTMEVPEYVQQTKKAFPNSENLDPRAFSMLVSLVFNRGSSMTGPSRSEMRNIRDLVQTSPVDYNAIAAQIRHMEHLWIGTTIYDGMKARRDAEAAVVASCAK